jgi:hypothetical protein
MAEPICPKRLVRRQCAEAFGVDEHRMVGGNRARDVITPRHATCYVLRARFPALSLPRIGALMGGRDHSTILHGLRRVEALMARDPELRAKVDALISGQAAAQHDAHVRAWRDQVLDEAIAARRKIERAAQVRNYTSGFLDDVAEGVRVISLSRNVSEKNALSPDDRDAVRRKVGSDALSRAVAKAGGWR